MKKISLLIVLTMLMSCFTIPAAMASDSVQDNVLADMNFNGETNELFKPIGFIGLPSAAEVDATKVYYYTANTIGVEDDKLKLGSGSVSAVIPFSSAVDSGIVKFDADIDIKSLILDSANSIYNNLAAGVVNDQTENSGRKQLLNMNCNKAIYGITNTVVTNTDFNFGETTHLTILFDLDNHKYTISIKKADGTVLTSPELIDTYNLTSIRGLYFSGVSGNDPIYVDNVKVQTVERELNVGKQLLASDDFNSYTVGTFKDSGISYSSNGANPNTATVPGKWYTYNESKMQIVIDENDSNNKLLSMDGTGTSYALLAFEPQESQLISYELDAKVSLENGSVLNIGAGDPDKNERIACLAINGQAKAIYGNNPNNFNINASYSGEWVHVKLEFDNNSDTYNLYVTNKDTGSVIVKRVDESRNSTNKNKKVNTFVLEGMNAWIDNVKAEKIEVSQIKLDSAKAVTDNFESGNIVMGKNSQAADSAEVIDDNGNKVLSMGKSTTNSSQDNACVNAEYPFKAGSVYTIKYDVKPDKDMVSMLRLNGGGADKAAIYPLNFAKNSADNKLYAGFHGNPGYACGDAANAGNDVTSGVWYTVTTTLDLVNMQAESTVTTRDHVDGEEVVTKSGTTTISNVPNGYAFLLWDVKNSADRTYFDNFSLSANGEKIKFANNMVKFVTADNQEIAYSDGAAALNPETNKIEITFNTAVNSDSINAKTVALYDKTGAKLDSTVSTDGNKVVLALNEALLPSNPYILYVSSVVTGITGANLGNAQQLSFKTGKGKLKSKLNFVGTTGQANAFEGGEKFNINMTVSNGTGEEQPIYIYVAYFDSENMLCKIQPLSQEISADKVSDETINVSFDVMSENEILYSDISKLTVFVWDGGMKPLDKTKSVEAKQ